MKGQGNVKSSWFILTTFWLIELLHGPLHSCHAVHCVSNYVQKITEFIMFSNLIKKFAFALLMLKICNALKRMSQRRINNLTNLHTVYFSWHIVEIQKTVPASIKVLSNYEIAIPPQCLNILCSIFNHLLIIYTGL